MAANFYQKQFCSRQNIVQNLTTSSTSAASSAFSSQTYQIMLMTASAGCYVVIGNSPTASTTTGTLIPTNVPTYFAVTPGEAVAAVTAAAGSLSITELA